MMQLVVYLLICIVVLLCTEQKDRTKVAGLWLVVGLLIALLSKLPFDPFTLLWALIVDVFHLAWEHLRVTVYLVMGLIFAVYIGMLVYAGVKDWRDSKAIRDEWESSNGQVRVKFNLRVEQLIKLGHDRDRAEAAALRVAQKK